MTPEVRELVDIAWVAAGFAQAQGDMTIMNALIKAIRAVEALEDPATAHKATIDRRVSEDDGGRMHAKSMGVEE